MHRCNVDKGKLTRIVEKRGKRLITSYTNSGVKDSPYCSSSLSFNRIRSFSTDDAESMTLNSLMNMILRQSQPGKYSLAGKGPNIASIKGVSLLKLCTARIPM